MKDILNDKKMLYVGICVLVIGLAFAIGTYAYYSSTITGSATGQILAYTCTSNNTTSFNINDLTNMYPGYSATRTINLDASIYTNATVEVTSYTNMGTVGSSHPNLAIYNDQNHQYKMSAGTNVINATITPGTTTSVPLYIYWPYNGEDTYSSDIPSATITITCNQGLLPSEIAASKGITGVSDSVLKEIAGAVRYTGADNDVNNYVSFNNGELWRIIGIYENQLKIVRASKLTNNRNYNENTSDGNAWAGSDLEVWLNDEVAGYYSTLDSTAKSMIVSGTWNAGAVRANARAGYVYPGAQETQVTRKVGLLATYEYLYAADSSCYETTGSFYNSGSPTCASKDWLKIPLESGQNDLVEWTLSPFSANWNTFVLTLVSDGTVSSSYGRVDIPYAVRPVVYLNSSVRISGGQGTDTQPYTLSLN